jgi:hypothetical protein
LPLYSASQLQFPAPVPTTVRSYDGSEVLSVSGWDIEQRRAAAKPAAPPAAPSQMKGVIASLISPKGVAGVTAF